MPLVEVAANEDEAPCSARRLDEVLDKRERYKDVPRCGTAKKENGEKTLRNIFTLICSASSLMEDKH